MHYRFIFKPLFDSQKKSLLLNAFYIKTFNGNVLFVLASLERNRNQFAFIKTLEIAFWLGL